MSCGSPVRPSNLPTNPPPPIPPAAPSLVPPLICPPPPPLCPAKVATKLVGSNKKLSPAALKGLNPNETVTLAPEEMVEAALKRFTNFNQEYRSCRKEVFNHPVQPQLQEGPQCGLVAVSMASQLVIQSQPTNTDKIFEYAKEREYTKQGEMFSASNLLDLCRNFVTLDSWLCDVDSLSNTSQICADLLSGHIFIVPYDCDFSHGPCLENGKKAHWALITGFVVLSHQSEYCDNIQWLSEQNCDTDSLSNKKVYLFGRQSKSLVLGVWDCEELVASNKNLKIVDDKRNSDDYIIPEGGLEAGLSNQIIKLKIK